MDGVIIDSEPLHKQIETDLLEELGGTINDEDYKRFVGTTDYYMWSAFKGQFNLKPTVEEMIATKKSRFMEQVHNIPLVANFEIILDAFVAKGYITALASSNNRKTVDEVI